MSKQSNIGENEMKLKNVKKAIDEKRQAIAGMTNFYLTVDGDTVSVINTNKSYYICSSFGKVIIIKK